MSNRGRAIVNGSLVPVVGMVCMDQLMLDVTDAECAPYDDVVLLGRSGNSAVSAEDLADWMGTINYEVTSSLGPRVPRIYTRNRREVSGRSMSGRWD